VDEFERTSIKQLPNCRMFNTCSNCSATLTITSLPQAGVVSSTQIGFEGDVDGDEQCDTVCTACGFRWQLPADWNLSLHDSARPVNKVDGPPLSRFLCSSIHQQLQRW